jgi:hypothetical protein
LYNPLSTLAALGELPDTEDAEKGSGKVISEHKRFRLKVWNILDEPFSNRQAKVGIHNPCLPALLRQTQINVFIHHGNYVYF